jgi:hypothetical protein
LRLYRSPSTDLIKPTDNDDSYENLALNPDATPYNASVVEPVLESNARQVLPESQPDTLPLDPSDHVLVDPRLEKAVKLFPSYLSEGIKRGLDTGGRSFLVAHISMTFPSAPVTYQKPRVVMSLGVMDNKVEHLASVLFGVHLESTAGLRYVYLPGGGKILPNPKFTIRGCQTDQILSIFGADIYQAIVAGPQYQDERQHGYSRTDCVSMLISQEVLDGATFLISLAAMEGTEIKNRLYD